MNPLRVMTWTAGFFSALYALTGNFSFMVACMGMLAVAMIEAHDKHVEMLTIGNMEKLLVDILIVSGFVRAFFDNVVLGLLLIVAVFATMRFVVFIADEEAQRKRGM